jgi:pimeloyl-ACP methyl ester carboxylesterase
MQGSKLRLTLAGITMALALLVLASPAMGGVRFERIAGYDDPATPDNLDKVGILKVGPKKAPNVLIINPGTSASSAYFKPVMDFIVSELEGWQVWTIERRENLLEDHSMLDQAKARLINGDQLFDYYLGYLTDDSITTHYQPVPDDQVPFARGWGMKVAVMDIRQVVKQARKVTKQAAKAKDKPVGKIVLGGHSLGGSITTAYATWDFNGKPGAKDLSGLVFIDGGSGPTPITPEEAQQRLDSLNSGTPWLAFGGIPAPFAGLFNIVGSTGTILDPAGHGKLQDWPLLPSNLKPPYNATNEAAYGFALDTETSPASLSAAQAHLGHAAESGDPRTWDNAGELTPIQRYADMFSGTGLQGLDGTAWYHPLRLTIDAGAVAAGNANPAQDILDVDATHGADLGKAMRIFVFGAALGNQRVIDAANALAQQSGIKAGKMVRLNRADTYAHNDPNSAFPNNEFVDKLVPFLEKIGRS